MTFADDFEHFETIQFGILDQFSNFADLTRMTMTQHSEYTRYLISQLWLAFCS